MLVGLDILSLARFQFAMTTIFHFFFVPLSIGLALTVSIMETIYVVKNDLLYKRMAQFWGRIFLLSFAVGVVTGIIQEFQFGMNWSDYSRFMGDIFGAPLAIEALVAFFMESTFIGLWMFSWDRFSKGIHLAFIWLTTLGTMISAMWILAANSFMQNPLGYIINPQTGRAQMVNFGAIIANPQLWLELPHVLFGAFVTGAFVVAGMSAFKLLKKQNVEFFRKSIKVSLIVGLVATIGVAAVGDLQTRYIIKEQPMKFAATEGLYKNSGDPAAWAVVASFNTKQKKTNWSIDVPYVLSILSYHKLSGSVKGMNQLNKQFHAKYDHKYGKDVNYYVPTRTLFWSFRVMTISAGVFGLIALLGLFFDRAKSEAIITQKWFLWILAICTFLPFAANTAGWLITELGRYPWVVYGLLTIADAVSPNVSAASLLFSNIVYFCLFSGLGGVMIFLSSRELRHGPTDLLKQAADAPYDPYGKGAFDHE